MAFIAGKKKRKRNTSDYRKIDKIMKAEGGWRVGTNTAWLILSTDNANTIHKRIVDNVKASNLTASKFTLVVGVIGTSIKEVISL